MRYLTPFLLGLVLLFTSCASSGSRGVSSEAKLAIATLVLSEAAYELPEEQRGPALLILQDLDQVRILYAGIEAGTNTRAELVAKLSVLTERVAQLAGAEINPRLARGLRLVTGIVAILAADPEPSPETAAGEAQGPGE